MIDRLLRGPVLFCGSWKPEYGSGKKVRFLSMTLRERFREHVDNEEGKANLAHCWDRMTVGLGNRMSRVETVCFYDSKDS